MTPDDRALRQAEYQKEYRHNQELEEKDMEEDRSHVESQIEQMAVEYHRKAIEKPVEIRGLEYLQMVNRLIYGAMFPERKEGNGKIESTHQI